MANEAWYQRVAAGVAAGNEVRLRVDGDSMMPFIRPGDLLLVTPASLEQLQHGDVVAVRRPEGDIVSHRIVTKSDAAIVTKGDNRRAPDPVWSANDVLGRVVAIERDDTTIDVRTRRHRAVGWVVGLLSRLEMHLFRGARWLKQRIFRE